MNAKTRLARGEAVGCSLDGCNRKHYAKTYCQLHYSRVKKDGSPGAVGKLIADDGLSMFVTKNGYLSTYHPETGRQILAHRLVMERVIGRPLYKHENVHHLNGDRQDNRPENLELWSSAQPSGQRIADKVAWAKWILAEYGDMA